MVGFAGDMTLKPYSQRLIDYFYKSGMRYGITLDSLWFNIHGHFASIIRLTQKSWELHYLAHTYRFHNQSEMIEWIEKQRKGTE